MSMQYIASDGRTIELDGPLTVSGIAADFRSRSWSYSLGRRDVRSIARPARIARISVTMPYDEANDMRKAFDADVSKNTPGTFVIGGVWKQRGLVLEQAVSKLMGERVQAKLTVALLDGAWWRIASVPFVPESGTSPELYPYLDYGMDFDLDYGRPPLSHSVETDASVASPVRIIIYGPATDPYIIAGGNRYQVFTNVSQDAYLVIDGKTKTIELVNVDGSVVNEFANGLRGSGEGGGQYVFEPVPTGTVNVSWDNSFGFDFGWYQEEGEPPWTRY